MSLNKWCCLTLSIILCCGSAARADEKKPAKAIAAFGTLQVADEAKARADAQAWLTKVKADAATQKAFEAIWQDGDRSILDRVTATFILGDDTAKKLMTEARDPAAPAP